MSTETRSVKNPFNLKAADRKIMRLFHKTATNQRKRLLDSSKDCGVSIGLELGNNQDQETEPNWINSTLSQIR